MMLSLIPRFSPWPVPRPVYDVGPGPVALLRGNYDHGWFGEVAASELITGEALASKLGLTAGTPHNNATPWLKFAYQGKFLFMPKRPLRVDLSWNDILAVSAVYGDKVIQVGNHLFKVRLPKGALTDPAIVTQSNVQWGSEWDYTYGHVRGPTAYVSAANAFAAYTAEDTLTTTAPILASYTMCTESLQNNTHHIKRQGVATYNVETGKSWSRYDYGWRPVLEYVGSAVVGYDPNLWLQYTFKDNEPINEVSETFALLAGAAVLTNKELVTNPASFQNYLSTNPIWFEADQDFSISLNLNMPFSDVRAYNTILGVYNTSATPSAWALGRIGNAGGSPPGTLNFAFTSGGTKYDFFSNTTLEANTDYHVKVARKDGVLYMFVNGALEGSWPMALGNARQAYVPLRTDVLFAVGQSQSSHIGGGRKWNLQILKGASSDTSAFTPPAELPVVGRLTYDQETSDAIRVQMDLRRDNAVNEANRHGVQLSGTARVANGAITHTSATSSFYTAYMEPFGQGDFTVELSFNLSAINATHGAYLAGQWVRGSSASPDNCWLVYAGSTRLIQFAWGRSAAANDIEFITTPNAAFNLNTDNTLVIERVGTTLTLYLNEVQVAQGTCAIPLRTNTPAYVRSQSAANLTTFAGKIWNLRIADKAMYNGEVTRQPQFPKLHPRSQYAPEVLADIAVQVSLRNGNSRNEKTGQNITTSGTASVQRDGITTTLAVTSRFYIPVTHFGAADFTIELKLTMISSTGASTRPIFGQFRGGTEPSSWILYTLGTNLAFQANDQVGGTVTLDSASVGKTWVAGVEYHVVVERVGSTVSMYIDGALIGTGALAGNLVNMDAYPHITNLYDTSTSKYCASKIRDVRVAKRALFNGNIHDAPLPEIPNQKPSLMMGSVTGPTLHGAAQNLDYLNGMSSAGLFSHTLFRDIRDPQNVKTVRLVALVNDRSYTVLAYRPSDIPPTPDMPVFTNTLKIGESTVTLSGAPSASVKAGAIGLYWGGPLLGANTRGRCVPFEFI